MTTFKSVKGPEEIRTVSGSQFYELYGSQNDVLFSKYDQPLLQASMNINNGANLICKRAVLDSAKLANATFGIVLRHNIKTTVAYDDNNNITSVTFGNVKTEGSDPNIKYYFNYSAVNGCMYQITPIVYSINVDNDIKTYNEQKENIITKIKDNGINDTDINMINGMKNSYPSLPICHIDTKNKRDIKDFLEKDAKLDFEHNVFRLSYDGTASTLTITPAVKNASTTSQLKKAIDLITTAYIFPLFTIFDNGRGNSTKSIAVSFDSASSKTLNQAIYTLKIIDYKTNKSLESIAFTINPYAKNNSTGYTFDIESGTNFKSNQISTKMYYDSYDKFIKFLNDNFIDENIFNNYDCLFGHDIRGTQLTNNQIGKENICVGSSDANNLDTINPSSTIAYYYYNNIARTRSGISEKLLFGSDGEELESHDTYNIQYKNFFSGKFDYDVFNVDTLFPNFIFDANYDDDTKLEIQKLAAFRGDLIAYLDMGTDGLTNASTIVSKIPMYDSETNTKYIRDMHCAVTSIYGDIRDPYTNKQITVTGTYQLSNAMINHYINAFGKPFCGKGNGITFSNYIQGTVNYIPKVYPNYKNTSEFLNGINNTYITDDSVVVNEKQTFCDAHVNYGSYYNGLFTMDTEYTLNRTESEFSYINNVMLVNDLIQEIRKSCPSARYNFIDEEDLEVYEKAVTTVINAKRSKFASIKFKYVQDENSINNKIFYAALEIVFRPFAQAEIFTITALNYSTLDTNVTTA